MIEKAKSFRYTNELAGIPKYYVLLDDILTERNSIANELERISGLLCEFHHKDVNMYSFRLNKVFDNLDKLAKGLRTSTEDVSKELRENGK